MPRTAILEAGGDNSYENLADAAPQLLARNLGTVLMTTDPFHEDRSMAIASSTARRPSDELSTGRKAIWIVGSSVGWLFLGVVGAFVAVVYLVGPRKRMNAARW